MRIDPICDYIARKLNCYISFYGPEQHLVKQWCSRPDFSDPFLASGPIRSFLLSETGKTVSFPAVYMINGRIAYTRFPGNGGFFLMGPILLESSSLNARALHMLDSAETPDTADAEERLSLAGCTAVELLRYSLLLFNIFQENDLDLWDCFQKNFDSAPSRDLLERSTSAALFENRENARTHNPYGQEMRLMRAIETGNLEQLRQSWQETYPGVLGTTSKDPVRNGKNLAQYVISASARAAIRGGLQPEMVFTLTDAYSQQVDELKDMSTLEPLVMDVERQLTLMVRDMLSRRRQPPGQTLPVVENCKQYIFSHLHSRLTVQEIAAELRIHPSYLSTVFRKQEGISIYKYILRQKIDLTKNLLTYSDYSFLEIANYLGFVSQSHLGKQFKTITGMTLKEYRDIYHKDENFS